MRDGQDCTLLVVENEPGMVHAIRRLFRASPVRVFTASCATAALEKCGNSRIEVVVSDNRLLGISGVELLRRIRVLSPDTVRVIVSEQFDIDSVLAAYDAGDLFRFITKPWSDHDLHFTINLALAQRWLIPQAWLTAREVKRRGRIIEAIEKTEPEFVSLQER